MADDAPSPTTTVERRPKLALALVVALALAASWWLQGRPPPWRTLELTPVVEAALKSDGGPSVGAADADVVIVLFTDYQCAVCKRTDPAMDRLLAEDPRVRVVYKNWPILGDASSLAAQVALAADRQGKYVEVHRGLMASRAKLDAARIQQIAVAAGVDWSRLESDRKVHRAAIQARLDDHATQAWSLGLQGTPGYLVGPFLVKGGLDDRALRKAVAEAREAGPPR